MPPPNWFQFDPDRAPDTDFDPGELHHLCVGNEGRLRDFRRTPVRIEGLRDDAGLITLKILAFEDQGALWDLPFERVGQLQFKKDSRAASREALERIEDAIRRLDRDVEIPCDLAKKEVVLRRIAEERVRAREWLARHSRFFQSGLQIPEGEPEGSPLLYADTQAYMTERNLGDLEAFFTRQYVTHMVNESVKAHRIAIAQLGLAGYKGKILRDPAQAEEELCFDRRQAHVMARMGFVHAMFELAGRETVLLYRMESSEGPLRRRQMETALVSASFRMDIVQEMSGWADPRRTVAMYRQAVPITRVLMTYLETEAMNHPYREAEAVLLADPTNHAF
jgi:hypothetical protein